MEKCLIEPETLRKILTRCPPPKEFLVGQSVDIDPGKDAPDERVGDFRPQPDEAEVERVRKRIEDQLKKLPLTLTACAVLPH